jgi:competence protein ComEC
MYVLDVGQGDAIVLRTPAGRWVAVDAGPRIGSRDAGRQVVGPFLRRRGVSRLAALFVTHGDADHAGGARSLLDALPADVAVDPAMPLPTSPYLEYLAAVESGGGAWAAGRSGDSLLIDGVQLAVLHPSEAWMRREARANEASLVLHVRYGCFDALLMGDAGVPVEEALHDVWPNVDVLKVGHHGSRTATGTAFLERVRPSIAVVSVGRNRYGHPAPDVLDRLRTAAVTVFRTDRDGTVTLRTDGDYLEVVTSRRAPWEGRISCLLHSLRSNGSSSSRNACTRRPRVSSPICSTTSRSRRR